MLLCTLELCVSSLLVTDPCREFIVLLCTLELSLLVTGACKNHNCDLKKVPTRRG